MKHSHSSLALFEQCPYRYMRERIRRDVPYVQNEAAKWGDQVHTGIEKFFETGDMPDYLYSYQEWIMHAANLRGERMIEAKLAVNRQWHPVAYSDPTAYFRGKVDLSLLREDECIFVDWKTGNSKYGDGGQAQRYAAMLMVHYPEIDRVRTRFVYFKDDAVHRKEFTRDQLLDLTNEVDSLVEQIEHCIAVDGWHKKSGPLCRSYCDVLDCEYNGKSK